jgi:hypothetical protein
VLTLWRGEKFLSHVRYHTLVVQPIALSLYQLSYPSSVYKPLCLKKFIHRTYDLQTLHKLIRLLVLITNWAAYLDIHTSFCACHWIDFKPSGKFLLEAQYYWNRQNYPCLYYQHHTWHQLIPYILVNSCFQHMSGHSRDTHLLHNMFCYTGSSTSLLYYTLIFYQLYCAQTYSSTLTAKLIVLYSTLWWWYHSIQCTHAHTRVQAYAVYYLKNSLGYNTTFNSAIWKSTTGPLIFNSHPHKLFHQGPV